MKNERPESQRKPEQRNRPGETFEDTEEIREENLDKTIEDSFPASDPPSSIPDPEDKEDAA